MIAVVVTIEAVAGKEEELIKALRITVAPSRVV